MQAKHVLLGVLSLIVLMPKRKANYIGLVGNDVFKIGDRVTIKGRQYKIAPPRAKGKRFSAIPTDGKAGVINFGDSNAEVRPYTKKGNSYCNRTYYIKSKPYATANDFSRKNWACRGKKSKR